MLAIVAALLFVSTGALGAMFYAAMKNSAGQAKEIEANGRQIAELRAKAKASEDEAVKARNERETLRFDLARDDKCRDAGKAYKTASDAHDSAKIDTAWWLITSYC